jgi:hypothetical protein
MATASGDAYRPPAVPLVAPDPYFAIWTMGVDAHGSWPKHWTGHTQALYGMNRVDGVTRRFLGQVPQAMAAVKSEMVRVEKKRRAGGQWQVSCGKWQA